MKLHYRIIGRLSVALIVILTVWAGLFYFALMDEVNDEVDDSLEDYSEVIITRKLAGERLPSHNNGSNRVIMSQGTGPALKEGGRISFYYAGYIFNGNLNASNIFATNNQAFAEENGWNVSDPDYEVKTAVLAEGELLEGLLYGLEGVREGEVCLILFSGKYGYGKKHIGTIPANSALAFQIWVERVSE